MKPVFHPLGDSGITISLADIVTRDATRSCRHAAQLIRSASIRHVEEVVTAYTAVTVFYDSLHASYDQLCSDISRALENPRRSKQNTMPVRTHAIPVVYDGADLDSVAELAKISREAVIEIHSSRTYDVDLLGFVPGFAYLSEVDPRLALPRRSQPRPRVPAGSVAIAAGLTGVYPFDTPGGWHLLGRTTTVMFDPRRDEPSLLRPGEKVKFEPVA